MRNAACLAFLLSLPPAAAYAQAGPADIADAKDSIVVTSTRLKDSGAALKACIEQRCPPEKDIAAALAHAENLFVAGDYKGARDTLQDARARNRRYAAQYPVAVAGLVRANARIAQHLGEGDGYRLNIIDTVDVLKQGLPDDDPRILLARLEVGDMWARFGRTEAAEASYRSVIGRARKLDLPNVQGLAMLRLASALDVAAGSNGMDGGARDVLEQIIANPDPRFKSYAQAARLLEARMAYRQGDPRATNAMTALFKEMPAVEKPVLMYAPPVDANVLASVRAPFTDSRSELYNMAMEDFENQWVDIAFYVTPDGRVRDAAVLRESPKLDHGGRWVQAVLTSIGGRRYLPLKMDPADPGAIRIERYTRVSLWETRAGSHIQQRSADGRIEVLDLTPEPKRTVATN